MYEKCIIGGVKKLQKRCIDIFERPHATPTPDSVLFLNDKRIICLNSVNHSAEFKGFTPNLTELNGFTPHLRSTTHFTSVVTLHKGRLRACVGARWVIMQTNALKRKELFCLCSIVSAVYLSLCRSTF